MGVGPLHQLEIARSSFLTEYQYPPAEVDPGVQPSGSNSDSNAPKSMEKWDRLHHFNFSLKLAMAARKFSINAQFGNQTADIEYRPIFAIGPDMAMEVRLFSGFSLGLEGVFLISDNDKMFADRLHDAVREEERLPLRKFGRPQMDLPKEPEEDTDLQSHVSLFGRYFFPATSSTFPSVKLGYGLAWLLVTDRDSDKAFNEQISVSGTVLSAGVGILHVSPKYPAQTFEIDYINAAMKSFRKDVVEFLKESRVVNLDITIHTVLFQAGLVF